MSDLGYFPVILRKFCLWKNGTLLGFVCGFFVCSDVYFVIQRASIKKVAKEIQMRTVFVSFMNWLLYVLRLIKTFLESRKASL